jgi:hypothetical protein
LLINFTANDNSRSTEPEDPIIPMLPKGWALVDSNPPEAGIFKNMAFSVSYVKRDNEKERVLGLIKQHGGRVLETGFDELFDMTASETSLAADDDASNSLVLTPEAREISFACLIADEHSRKAKFMQALALGLPCVSGLWIEHCVAKGRILDWDSYLLAAGESSFLGGAVRNRNLQPYSAVTAKFAEQVELREKLLAGKSILLVMGKGRAEERKKAYLFLTYALGPRHVKRVQTNREARKVLIEAEKSKENINWLYVDDGEDAEKVIFGALGAGAGMTSKKRKKGIEEDEDQNLPPKKVRIVRDEYVIQSLILGKLLDEE